MPSGNPQLNVRVEAETLEKIDRKRIELQRILGRIPSRSEVVRMALLQFVAGK